MTNQLIKNELMDFIPMRNSESDSDSDSDSECEMTTEPDDTQDIIIELTECFDQHKLNFILKNKKKFKKQMRKSCFENDHNPFTIMEKYLEKSRKGKIKVTYKQNKGKGRFFAVGGLSMQSLPREVRQTIGCSFYIDIDMVNCHPVILSFLCHQRNIPCKYLDRYISNRDELLAKLKVDRETGKVAVLSFMNGGAKAYNQLEYHPSWIKKMKKEIDNIHKQFSLDEAFDSHRQTRENKGITYNHKGSYMNILLCDFENKILQEMWKFFGSATNGVLCFDGLMLPAAGKYDLEACVSFIFETLGIQMALKIKPMDEGFDLGNVDIPKYEDKEWYFHNMRDFCIQAPNINQEKLKEWMKDTCIIALQRGRSMLFTKNLELDGSISYEPQESLSLPNFSWQLTSDKKPQKFSFNTIFDQIKWQNSWDYFNFIPFLTDEQESKISPRLFNTFSGYRWAYTPKIYELDSEGLPIPPASIKPWIDHIKNTLCKSGQSSADLGHRIIQWYAHIFQNPTVKPWALVFMSEEGLGKGLWQTFFEQVLTKALATTFTSWDQITGSFNGKMAGKLLFTLNEATNYPTNTQKELMKTIIKDTELSVNKKFVNQYDVDNYARVQITTNNKRPVAIDYDDRRYCCIESDNSVRGNTEYFKPLIDSRNDEQTQHDMFDFLTNYPLDGFNSEKPPMTRWKRELIGQNLCPPMEFIKELMSGEIVGYTIEEDEPLKIKGKDLYESYVRWCSESGEHRAGNNRSFFAELKTKKILQKSLRIDGSVTKGVTLIKTEIQAKIAELLCNPEFEF